MSKREKPYSIIATELPEIKKRAKEPFYDALLDDMRTKPKGSYQVSWKDKQVKTMYSMLYKKIKGRGMTDLKLHVIDKKLYIEKL